MTSAAGGLWVFLPPTSQTDFAIMTAEKVIGSLPVWPRIWNAISLNGNLNNPPSAVVFNGLVYAFYRQKQGTAYDIVFNTCSGGTWSAAQVVPDAFESTSPGSAVYNNVLYVFYQGLNLAMNPDGQLYFNTLDTSGNWSGPQSPYSSVGMSGYPSAAAFNGNLYIFYEGNGNLNYSLLSGSSWYESVVVPNVGVSKSPSAIVFTDPGTGATGLYVFHQGGSNNGQLWYNVLDEGGNWAGDKQITTVGSMQASPAAFVHQGTLYVLYDGGGTDLYYVYAIGNGQWSTPIQVARIGLSNQPSLAVLGTQLIYVAMGQSQSDELWYSSVSQGDNWGVMTRVPNVSLSYWPGLAVFNQQVYCFMQDSQKQGNLNYITFNGTTWASQIQTAGSDMMSWAPSPVLFDSDLYVFFQGPGNNGSLRYVQSTNGSTWTAPATVPHAGMSFSPSAVAFGGRLFVFYNAMSQKNQVCYSILSNGSWSESMEVPGIDVLGCYPSAVVFNGELYVFYLNASYAVCYMQYTGGSNTWGPSITLGNASSNYETGYFTTIVYNNGSAETLALYFQGPSNNGLLYCMTTTDASSASKWSAVAQAGVALPSFAKPKPPRVRGFKVRESGGEEGTTSDLDVLDRALY